MFHFYHTWTSNSIKRWSEIALCSMFDDFLIPKTNQNHIGFKPVPRWTHPLDLWYYRAWHAKPSVAKENQKNIFTLTRKFPSHVHHPQTLKKNVYGCYGPGTFWKLLLLISDIPSALDIVQGYSIGLRRRIGAYNGGYFILFTTNFHSQK